MTGRLQLIGFDLAIPVKWGLSHLFYPRAHCNKWNTGHRKLVVSVLVDVLSKQQNDTNTSAGIVKRTLDQALFYFSILCSSNNLSNVLFCLGMVCLHFWQDLHNLKCRRRYNYDGCQLCSFVSLNIRASLECVKADSIYHLSDIN